MIHDKTDGTFSILDCQLRLKNDTVTYSCREFDSLQEYAAYIICDIHIL